MISSTVEKMVSRGWLSNIAFIGWIICVILGLVLGSVWGLFLGAGIVVALFYVACHIYNSKLEKAMSSIELPAMEKFINEYEQWRRDNNISAW